MIPVKIILYRSDAITEATLTFVNPGLPTVGERSASFFVDMPIGVKWPKNITGDKIQFVENEYANEYEITNRTDSRLTINGDTNITEGATKKWQIKGFRRAQRMEIKAISMKFAYLDNVGDKYSKSEDGDNS